MIASAASKMSLLVSAFRQSFSAACRSTRLISRQSKRSYTCAITRGIPDSFTKALSSKADSHTTISVDKAREEHAQYVSFMRTVVPTVHLPASQEYPDCPFVEDAAVVIGKKAVICKIGAKSREGEVDAVRNALIQLGLEVVDMEKECKGATVDGGDVLYPVTSMMGSIGLQMDDGTRTPTVLPGRHLFVGLSGRTNMDGVKVLAKAFGGQDAGAYGVEVVPVPIPSIEETGALHLKSIVTHVDAHTLLVSQGQLGDDVLAAMKAGEREYDAIPLPDIAACNVVVVNGVAMASPTECQESKVIFENAMKERDLEIKYIPNVEYAKCDGAMTCRSILLDI